MSKAKKKIQHAAVVQLFAERLRELRISRGLTQAELATKAKITTSYVGRLESASAAPGIDLVARLADALGTTTHDLLPAQTSTETLNVLQQRAKSLFDALMESADRETLLMVCPLLARLGESPTRRR